MNRASETCGLPSSTPQYARQEPQKAKGDSKGQKEYLKTKNIWAKNTPMLKQTNKQKPKPNLQVDQRSTPRQIIDH